MRILYIGYYKNTFALFEEGCINARARLGETQTLPTLAWASLHE